MENTYKKIQERPEADYFHLCEPALEAFQKAVEPFKEEAVKLTKEWADKLHLETRSDRLQPSGELELNALIKPAQQLVSEVDTAKDKLYAALHEQLKAKKARHESTKYDFELGKTWARIDAAVRKEISPATELLIRAETLSKPPPVTEASVAKAHAMPALGADAISERTARRYKLI